MTTPEKITAMNATLDALTDELGEIEQRRADLHRAIHTIKRERQFLVAKNQRTNPAL